MHTLMGILPATTGSYIPHCPSRVPPTWSLRIRQVCLLLQCSRVSVALLDEALDPQILAVEVQKLPVLCDEAAMISVL